MRKIDILDAIAKEKSRTSRFMIFEVISCKKNIKVYEVRVNTTKNKEGKLDEMLEGARVWWTEGYAEILSVIPEEETVVLRFLNGVPPKEGSVITIHPPVYIQSLEKTWKNNLYSSRALEWLETIKNSNEKLVEDSNTPISNVHNWLRTNQIKAFSLLDAKAGLLWGPPGTGKTTTVGVMLANYLKFNKKAKILLLSTTNLAVDQVLQSVNREFLNLNNGNNIESKEKIIRIGSRFIPKYYSDSKYLLGSADEKVLKKLLELDIKKPEKTDIENYQKWKVEYESLQKKVKQTLISSLEDKNLIAMTTTRALYDFNALNNKKFDLIIFDEASQIPLPQALMIAPLGKHVIFTGDPFQLSPVCQSTNKNAQNIFGNSIFKYKDSIFSKLTVFLDEQSRMKQEISKIVSHVFYKGKLKLAKIIPNLHNWKEERKLHNDPILGDNIIKNIIISQDSTWSRKYGGFIRFESAERIVEICELIADKYPKGSLFILTPFRAQKNLIRALLRARGLHSIKVSTVHKSQGSEYHTILFDPVCGEGDFLRAKGSENLINVAISRAKARLVTFTSIKDKKHPHINSIVNLINNTDNYCNGHIQQFVDHKNFPENILNKTIDFGKISGKVIKIERKTISIICSATGKIKKLSIEFIKNKFEKASFQDLAQKPEKPKSLPESTNSNIDYPANGDIKFLIEKGLFPDEILDNIIKFGDISGKVVEVTDKTFSLICSKTGKIKKFSIDFILRKFS